MDDMISAGVLLCFNMTNAALILIRAGVTQADAEAVARSHLCKQHLLSFTVAAMLLVGLLVNDDRLWTQSSVDSSLSSIGSSVGEAESITHQTMRLSAYLLLIACTLYFTYKISLQCDVKPSPLSSTDGSNGSNGSSDNPPTEDAYYRAPFVPYVPLLGSFLNLYLVAQLSLFGLCFVS